jgi:hypothetical protein
MTEPTPTIYSYYSPEVRTVVKTALIEQNRSDGIHATLKQNYDPGLDELHLPLMDRYERFARSEGVIGLNTFDEKYFTNGSSEGIFHLISGLLPGESLYQLDGEYQGYKAYGDAIGRMVHTATDLDELMDDGFHPGLVILSNPSSRSGNCVSNETIKYIGTKHRIVIDLAYMGMTQRPLNLDLTNPSIIAVVGSLSKPFGMYYYRIGFCYSRYPIASLYGNKWFKNALSIKLGEAVLDHFDPKNLQGFKDRYFDLQEKAVGKLNDMYNLDNRLAGATQRRARPSDVWLLANAPWRDFEPNDLLPFKRGEQNPMLSFLLDPVLHGE